MTTNNKKGTSNLSEAAKKMRSGATPEERSEGARKLGQAGGSQSHKGSSSGSHQRKEEE